MLEAIKQVCVTAVGIYAAGCVTYALSMFVEDYRRERAMPAWARRTAKPLFTEEDWLILPAIWPAFAYLWIKERLK